MDGRSLGGHRDEALNRNKSSIELDLTSSAGQQLFRDLAAVSDAVYRNLRGDVPAGWAWPTSNWRA